MKVKDGGGNGFVWCLLLKQVFSGLHRLFYDLYSVKVFDSNFF